VHDCAKEWSPAQLIAYAKKRRLNIPDLPSIRKASPNLLHAYCGAELAKERGWINDAPSYRAIASHTLGRIRITDPERILFVADYASKDRRFPAAARIRQVAIKDLKIGFLLALAGKISFNLMLHKPIHPLAKEVWNSEVMARL
jgi:nicotinate-nucleotide adenylyltransferase